MNPLRVVLKPPGFVRYRCRERLDNRSNVPLHSGNEMKPASESAATVEALAIPSDRYAWLIVGMLWFICFFNYVDRQAVFSVFPLLQREMHLSTVQLGLLGSSFAWVYGIGGPFAGLVADRIRRKTAILGGLQFWSIICAASALSRTFRQLLCFRAAEGLGETIYYPASTSLISDYHGRRTRSRALGFLVTSVYAGTVCGAYWAGAIAERYGWRISFVVLGVLGSLLGLILTKFLRERPRGSADLADLAKSTHSRAVFFHSPSEIFVTIIRTPTALLLMGAFVCANFVALVLLAWMPSFLYGKFHLSIAAAALNATIYPQAASAVGALLGGYLADRACKTTRSARLMIQTVGVVGGAPFVVACGLCSSLQGVIVALMCWGFFKGIYDANIFASAFDVIHPDARGTTSGLMNCVGWLIGGGAAPLAIGLLAGHMALGSAIAISASAYVLAGALLIVAMWNFLTPDLAHLDHMLAQTAISSNESRIE